MECGFGRFRRTDDKRGVLNPTPERVLNPLISLSFGGRGGIRTHGTLAGTPVFKTGALNHSATLPLQRHQSLSGRKIKNGSAAGPNSGPTLSPVVFQWTLRWFAGLAARVDNRIEA